jgi:hypothetical protein
MLSRCGTGDRGEKRRQLLYPVTRACGWKEVEVNIVPDHHSIMTIIDLIDYVRHALQCRTPTYEHFFGQRTLQAELAMCVELT